MKTQKDDILDILTELYNEAVRLYEANGRAAFESGRIDGIRWAMDEIQRRVQG